MGKSKKNRNRNRPRKTPKPKPKVPKLTLPGPMSIEEIQTLHGLLDQRQTLIEFRDSEPGSMYVKRNNDPRDMSVGLAKKSDRKLRVIFSELVQDTEKDLEDIGIDLSELEGYEPDTGDDEGDIATLLADATATLAKLKGATEADDDSGEGDGEGDEGEDEDLPTMLAKANATLEEINRRQAGVSDEADPAPDEPDPNDPDNPETED